MQGLIVFSRLGVYIHLPGVDAERFAETVQSGGILGYIDALSGGSISRVGIFSLGAHRSLIHSGQHSMTKIWESLLVFFSKTSLQRGEPQIGTHLGEPFGF